MKKLLPFFSPILATCLLLLATQSAKADFSLVVSPPSYEIEADPGSVVQKTVKISNNSNSQVIIDVTVVDFIVEDESGTPIPVHESASGRYLASPWFTLDKPKLTLEPHATEALTVIIAVPTDALAGGHYSMIALSPHDKNTPISTGAGVVPTLGSLFDITIKGDINYQALIKDFTTGQRFYEFGPIDFTAKIENQSDTHIKPQTSITVRDMLGRTVAGLDVEAVNIFPFTSREVAAKWDTIWGFGKYSATLTAIYGPGLSASRVVYFWIMPYKIIASLIIILLVIIATVVIVKRHLAHLADTRDSEIDELKRRIVELENDK